MAAKKKSSPPRRRKKSGSPVEKAESSFSGESSTQSSVVLVAEALVIFEDDEEEDDDEAMGCTAYEIDESDEDYVDVLLLTLLGEDFDEALELARLAEADEAVAQWYAETLDVPDPEEAKERRENDLAIARWVAEEMDDMSGDSDEAIARCLQGSFDDEEKAAELRKKPSLNYLAAAMTGVEKTAVETIPQVSSSGSSLDQQQSPIRTRRRGVTALELRRAAVAVHAASTSFRAAAIRSRAATGAASILTRDRAMARHELSRRQRDLAAALFFAANNHKLVDDYVASMPTLTQLAFQDILQKAANTIKKVAWCHKNIAGKKTTVDFHMLTTTEARQALAVILDTLARVLPGPPGRRLALSIVVGRGIHSGTGGPRLAPAVRRDLTKRKDLFVFEENTTNTGAFIVRPRPQVSQTLSPNKRR